MSNFGIITRKGLEADAKAVAEGTKVKLTKVQFSSTPVILTQEVTTLTGIIKELPIASYVDQGDGAVQFNVVDSSQDTYQLGSIGIYTENDILYAIFSEGLNKYITEKSEKERVVLSLDIIYTNVNKDRIQVVESGPEINLSVAEELAKIAASVVENQLSLVKIEEALKP